MGRMPAEGYKQPLSLRRLVCSYSKYLCSCHLLATTTTCPYMALSFREGLKRRHYRIAKENTNWTGCCALRNKTVSLLMWEDEQERVVIPFCQPYYNGHTLQAAYCTLLQTCKAGRKQEMREIANVNLISPAVLKNSHTRWCRVWSQRCGSG